MTQGSLFTPAACLSGAVFDGDPPDRYRYRLWRTWGYPFGDVDRRVLWVMTNPSTADGETDDRTIAKITRFTKKWGYGGLDVVNLFGLCATDPRELKVAVKAKRDPIGRSNDEHLRSLVESAATRLIVCAWGAHGTLLAREQAAERLLANTRGLALHCLRRTKGGHPEHPLYLPENLTPIVWR